MSKVRSPIETWSPSSSQRSGPKLRTPVMPKRSPLLTTLSSRYLSAMCGPSILTCSASRKSAAPPTWSIWPCVSQIFSTVTPVCLIASRILGTSPPGSITTAFLEGSSQIMVQFCSNSVTGTMIAPAFGWVSVEVSVCCVMAADCRFLASRQGKNLAFGAELGCELSYRRSRVEPAAAFGVASRNGFKGNFGMDQGGRDWWRHGIFYQIYPRSFQDSDGDGVGDIKGVIARLPYLKSLGIDAVWLSPIFPFPMADFA